MKKSFLIGVILIILGLLIAFGPTTIFPVCGVGVNETEAAVANESAEPPKPMKCKWTGRAELGIGITIAILGALIILMKDNKVNIGLSIAAALNGGLALASLNWLIGVCKMETMSCRLYTQPALTILSSFVVIVGIIGVLLFKKSSDIEIVSA